MKWFFATNQSSVENKADDWEALIKAAVRSCKENTVLEPCCIFDGPESSFTNWLRAAGVRIYFHRSSIYSHLDKICNSKYGGDKVRLQIASAAFLRIDIPDLIPDEEFALYTDCDVMFLQDPLRDVVMPDLLAFAPQMERGKYSDLNSGVMLINIPTMARELAEFRSFIINLSDFPLSYDQGAYKIHYANRYMSLPDELNWKPYWGGNSEARIVHFHGPKPFIASKLLSDPTYRTHEIYHQLFERDRLAYELYLSLWKSFGSD